MERPVTADDSHASHKRPATVRRALVVGVLVSGTSLLAACTPHQVAQTHPCATPSNRGAPQLAKIGLTPAELKAQAKCT
jgi:hypothetical protein